MKTVAMFGLFLTGLAAILVTAFAVDPQDEAIRAAASQTHIVQYYQKNGIREYLRTYAAISVSNIPAVPDDAPGNFEILFSGIYGVEKVTARTALAIRRWTDVIAFTWTKSKLTEVDGIPFGNVTKLDFSQNEIKQFAIKSKTNVPNLESLDVSDNLLHYVPDITELNKLKYLNLAGNRICRLGGMLASMPNLIEVHLSRNRIDRLDKPNFRHNRKIANLFVDNNLIAEIKPNTFVDNERLEKLDLSVNKLKHLPAELLAAVPNLIELNVAKNELKQLEANVFGNLKKLLLLDISGNLYDTLTAGVFAGADALQRLHIHETRLTGIDSAVFDDLKSVEALFLSDNRQLYHLCQNAFEKLLNLSVIDLSGNDLAQIPTSIVFSPYLRSVRLHDNPKLCTCNNVWLRTWIKNRKEAGEVVFSFDCNHQGTLDLDLYNSVDCHDKYGLTCERDRDFFASKKGKKFHGKGTFAVLEEQEENDGLFRQYYTEAARINRMAYRHAQMVQQPATAAVVQRQDKAKVVERTPEQTEPEPYRIIDGHYVTSLPHSSMAIGLTGLISFIYVFFRVMVFVMKAKGQNDLVIAEQHRLFDYGRNTLRFLRFALLQHLVVLRAEVFAQSVRISEHAKLQCVKMTRDYFDSVKRKRIVPSEETRKCYNIKIMDATLGGMVCIHNAYMAYMKQFYRIWNHLKSLEKIYRPHIRNQDEHPYVDMLNPVVHDLETWYLHCFEVDKVEHRIIDKNITEIMCDVDRNSYELQQLMASNNDKKFKFQSFDFPNLNVAIPTEEVVTTYKELFYYF